MNTAMKNVELLTWTPEMVKTYWDYESQFPEQFFAYRYGREIIEKLLPYLPQEGHTLDYGCGPGNLIERLLDTRLKVAGLDFSPTTIEVVVQRFRDRDNFLGAFEPKDLKDKEHLFDAITVVEVIEHLYDKQLDELLGNVHKLLRPGGTVAFTTPNEEILDNNYILCPVSGKLFHRWQHVRSWSAKSLAEYLTKKGFLIEKSLMTDFCVTFNTRHRPHPLREKLGALKKTIKYKLKPYKKRPHLVVIARTTELSETVW